VFHRFIAAVRADDLPHLHTFANGLEHDHAAVRNGLTLPYPSGAVEGNVCRAKATKRSRYGRAKPDLLRKLTLRAGQTDTTDRDRTTQRSPAPSTFAVLGDHVSAAAQAMSSAHVSSGCGWWGPGC
jgi:hypothetical protein